MANWWDEAPVVDAQAAPGGGGNWWESAPIVSNETPETGTPPNPAPADQSYTGSILPFSKDAEGNVSFDSDAGVLGTLKRALSLPGDVASGAVDPMSNEAIGRAFELAATASPLARVPKSAPPPPTAPALSQGQEAAAAAQRIGVPVPRAVTSDSMLTQQAGNIVQNVPLAGTPVRKAAESALEGLGNKATQISASFGRGGEASAQTGGAAVTSGVQRYIGKNGVLGDRLTRAYDAVDQYVDPAVTSPLIKTDEVARKIAARREAAAIPAESDAVRRIDTAVKREGGLTYEGIKDLRTYVGELMKSSNLPADISQAELKQIYGALSDDLRTAVQTAGGERAVSAFERANTYAAKVAERRESLNRLLKVQSDEAALDRIVAAAGSTGRADVTLLAQARKALGSEGWGDVASAAAARLGRQADGSFSPAKFHTDWNKLSDAGKAYLFRSSGKAELANALDDIAKVSARFKEFNRFANPSGTAQNVIGATGGVALFMEPISALTTAGGANIISRIVAQPTKAKAVAKWTRTYEVAAKSRSPRAIAALHAATRSLSATLGEHLNAAAILKQFETARPAYAEDDKA